MVLVFLTISDFATAQGTLKGTVTDSEGAVIRGARVLVHWDSSGSDVGLKSNVGLKTDVTVHTDDRGEFTTSLPPGFYDVFVSANAFSPTCLKARIIAGKLSIQKLKLQASPLVTKELGDPLP